MPIPGYRLHIDDYTSFIHTLHIFFTWGLLGKRRNAKESTKRCAASPRLSAKFEVIRDARSPTFVRVRAAGCQVHRHGDAAGLFARHDRGRDNFLVSPAALAPFAQCFLAALHLLYAFHLPRETDGPECVHTLFSGSPTSLQSPPVSKFCTMRRTYTVRPTPQLLSPIAVAADYPLNTGF